MEEHIENPQAFPRQYVNGMTLRDFIAVTALKSYMVGQDFKHLKTVEQMAQASYEMADAMLKQRKA